MIAGLDPLAGHVGDFLVDQLRRIGAADADQIAAVEPLARDALELAEQVQLRLFAGIAKFGVEQMPRQVKQDRRLAHVVEMRRGSDRRPRR